ncbi:MAG: hypothetical protein FWG02_11350 [Holophagaceae bacterium]|nr:hypothetical protein [Holophagaceae bacterium]
MTVTAQVAVWLPSAVAVIVASPTAMAVTVPLFTVAIPVLLLCHVTFLFVALLGCTDAVSVAVLPIWTDRVLVSVTPVTVILFSLPLEQETKSRAGTTQIPQFFVVYSI